MKNLIGAVLVAFGAFLIWGGYAIHDGLMTGVGSALCSVAVTYVISFRGECDEEW